ncbi:orotidine-5'-phosphate decarboxylase [Roseibium album]|uniref:Orotidine 5'-phosphate decarboxylase n=1 Tax=Roseibium album TaxID=311410 RepID=A0A0M7AF16_9HYPH|nr:orotidine-5'-phosphate decarboxylase [Roseibium album]MBG6163208.1 orotidine-5'-phosphate decarboxylase [Labrenzia sp. EL_195]CTQ58705.1 Orotidine 5'-phosphate decarboxylase [Roseibium album]CTQ67214.1 Orotidine 5'-phosphate decarboxylase [Roseibium album]CTQ72343.1 Orotidine 5'-phosphate decarboxylase [Roseibium album]
MPTSPFAPNTALDRLMLPVDVPTLKEAETLVSRTEGKVGVYKIGMELQFAGGLEFARDLAADGKKIFLDVKLHDIDNTITKAVRNVAKMGVAFMTLHGYPKTMRAAVRGLMEEGNPGLCLLGVTVLTSMDEEDLVAAGYRGPLADVVEARTRDAREAGMGGIVCAATEASNMRSILGDDLVIVTPGIRPAGSAAGDQRRVMTPEDAIRAGSDYLVVGRPISQAGDPGSAADAVVAEIEAALS